MASLENAYVSPSADLHDPDIDMQPTPPSHPPPSSFADQLDQQPTKRIAQVGGPIPPTSYKAPFLKSSSKSRAKGAKWLSGGKGGGKHWDNDSQVPIEGCSERWTKSYDVDGNETWSRVAIGRGADWGSSSSATPLWSKR